MTMCKRCGFDPWDDLRSWWGKEPVFATFGLGIMHPDENDVEMLGVRTAVYYAQWYADMRMPNGDIFIRDVSQRRK